MDNKENMGKDYFSQNNRVITNDEQFTSDVQKYNNTRVRDKKRLEKVGNLVKNSYLYR